MVSVFCGFGAAVWQLCCPDSMLAAAVGYALAVAGWLREWWGGDTTGEEST